MPNLYATPAEVKAQIPDAIRAAVTKYDQTLVNLLSQVSRWIDEECKRVFYPTLATRRFWGSGTRELWVPDLFSITSVEISWDYGNTYTALSADDYIATVAGDENNPRSWTLLLVNWNSQALSYWPTGQRAVRIVGGWGRTDNRDRAWQSTGDTVQDDPLTSGASVLTVGDVDGLDIYGALARFQGGQLLQIGSEYLETSLAIDTDAQTIGVTRGCNGSTAAEHAKDTAIGVWRAPEPVRDACIIQTVRQLMRGMQGFSDARAQPDVGQMFWFKAFDPEAARKLQDYGAPVIV